MRWMLLGITVTASLIGSLSSAFAAGGRSPPKGRITVDSYGASSSGALARTSAAQGVRAVTTTSRGDSRGRGELPKMTTALRMLPYAKSAGSSGLFGSSATRIGFRWVGREKETNPVSKNGRVIGEETRVVTRFFGRGTETVERKTAEQSSRTDYRYRQGSLGVNKSWEAHATSTQKVGDGTVVRIAATATGGDSRKEGIRASGNATSHVIEKGAVRAIGKASGDGT